MGDQTRPNVHTPPLGPRSEALLKRADDILLGVSLIGGWPPSHIVGRYRDGWFIADVDGNRYRDWINGWASAPLGGNHPSLVEAALQGLSDYGTECLSALRVEHQWALAERLREIAPPPLTKVDYDTTGSEERSHRATSRAGRPICSMEAAPVHRTGRRAAGWSRHAPVASPGDPERPGRGVRDRRVAGHAQIDPP